MKLLDSIKVGHTEFKNRIMFPPLTTGYEEKDGSIGDHSLNFYKRLAEGGVGYIVIGDVVPVQTFSPTPKLYSDAQIPTFKRLADTLHEYDCKLGLQIFHPEYDVDALFALFREGKMQEVYAKLHHDMLHYVNEATVEQLETILDRITACVKRAISAGVDVIEVHGDRLVGSLCSSIINKRTDEYGGSFENRTRFALRVVDAIKAASDKVTIEYKLPIVTKQKDGSYIGKGGLMIEEAVEFAKILEARGVHMIQVAQANHTGNMNDTIPAMGTRKYAFMSDECKMIKDVVSIPVACVGRIIDTKMGQDLLDKGICDIVAYGRPLLADPDIANKLEYGEECLIRHCICCNKGCTDNIQSRKFLSCVLNPENGYEYNRAIKKAKRSHNIAVVGAGIAGLEAARVAFAKGHKVTVFEKSNRLFGQLNVAAIPPRKDEMYRIFRYYEEVIKNSDIKIVLNHEFKAQDANGFDDVIVAVGAKPFHPNIPGMEKTIDAWDVLDTKEFVYGDVCIAGGGLVGVETAEYLANKGYNVTIIEMQDKIAKEESNTIMPTILTDFAKHNVNVLTNYKIKEFNDHSVTCDIIDKEGNAVQTIEIQCDTIVNALTSCKTKIDLEGVNANVVMVGDCMIGGVCNIDNATKSGYDAANSIGNE